MMDGKSLRIERTYQTSADRVFDAWTSEAVLRRWWQAERGGQTSEAEIDLRVGGAVRVVMYDPDRDVAYGGGGAYTEIEPPNRLAFTWLWDGDTRRTLIEIDFQETDGATTVRLTHSGLWDETAVRPHQGQVQEPQQPRTDAGGRVTTAASADIDDSGGRGRGPTPT